jgi:uncharacterized protein (DUF1330 family)
MKTYVIVDVRIDDPVEYEEYKKLTPGSLLPYHGKFVVRGGKSETIEGDWKPERIVVLEFPSMELAKGWWSSAEYTKAKAIRQRTAHTQMLFVEGVE